MLNFIGFSMVFAFVAIFVILLTAVWIWALVDCLRSEKETTEKLIWVLVLFLFNIIGAIVYFLLKDNTALDKKPRKKGDRKELRRNSQNRVVAGVCGGIGEYFNVDPTIIRLLWVILTIFSAGTGILLYLIAAIIIPSDNKPTKKSNKALAIILSIGALLLVLILGVVIIAAMAIQGYDHGTAVSKSIHVEVRDEQQQAEKIAKDHIMAHPNYQDFGGHDLFCGSSELVNEEACREYEDPYGITLYHPCYKVKCKFDADSPEARGFTAEAVVARGQVKRMSFRMYQEINTQDDCEAMGYEVLYPELKGGPLQCDTGGEVMNISSPICREMCGDGVCQEVVCMGSGCPCPEDKERCSSDCS